MKANERKCHNLTSSLSWWNQGRLSLHLWGGTPSEAQEEGWGRGLSGILVEALSSKAWWVKLKAWTSSPTVLKNPTLTDLGASAPTDKYLDPHSTNSAANHSFWQSSLCYGLATTTRLITCPFEFCHELECRDPQALQGHIHRHIMHSRERFLLEVRLASLNAYLYLEGLRLCSKYCKTCIKSRRCATIFISVDLTSSYLVSGYQSPTSFLDWIRVRFPLHQANFIFC